MTRRIHHVTLLALLAALTACGRTPPARFYTLESVATASGTPAAKYGILVGPVRIPPALDRPQVVVQVAANRVDIEAFSYLYPLADAALIRKMEGAEITMERLEYVTRASQGGTLREQVFSAFIGEAPREDFIPYTADFFLQLEGVKWTIVAGVVGASLIVSVRNLGYSRNAGEFVKRWFGDIGSAGGHRAMAKAVVPIERFRQKFGDLSGPAITAQIADLAEQFLREPLLDKKKEVIAR